MKKLPDEITITWHIEDVKSFEEDHEVPQEVRLTDDECRQVLALAKRHHDASLGINWDVLAVWIDEVHSQRQHER